MASGAERGPSTSGELAGQERHQAAAAEPTPQPRGWVWFSSVESAEAGKVSVLAIAETIAATAVYAWIAWRFGTLHLTISACVAPFLLLRTSESVTWAIGLTRRIVYALPLQRHPKSRRGLSLVIMIFYYQLLVMLIVLLTSAVAIGVRVFTTTITTFQSLLKSVAVVPSNWWLSAACIDSRHPVELLPGVSRMRSRYPAYFVPLKAIRAVLGQAQGSRIVQNLIIMPVMVPCMVVTLLLPAYFYRWSIKGAALIYSPLIWIVHSATARPLRDHLRDIRDLAAHRIARTYSAFVLVLFLAKVWLYYAWSDVASSWRTIPGNQLLDAFVMPEAFPVWHITGVFNAILAWALYLAADWVVARWNRGSRVNERAVELALRWLSLLRGVLSIYTIACGIYLAASLVERFGLPPLGTRIVPWP